MRVLLGLDVGTTGARAVAVDADSGAIVGSASAGYPLSTPRPGWIEQDPVDWWTASQEVLHAATLQAGGEPSALGLTGQMHGSVFLDEHDAVLRPALLWNDQRTAADCLEITKRVGAAELLAETGNPAVTGFQAPKILWLRRVEPRGYARVASVLLPKDYVRLRLTGDKATDAADASGTGLLDLRGRRWSDGVLAALEIPEEWLPRVHEGTETTGVLRPGVAESLGLPPGLPVAAGGGDNAAAAVGSGVARPGQMSSSIGTSGVLFAPTAEAAIDPSGRVHACCHSLPGVFHLMAVGLSAGGSLRWWRDVVGDVSFDVLVAEAARVEPGARGLLFLPYLTGDRTPHLDPSARGGFVGLTLRHGRAEMTRAVMEGVVMAMRDGLDLLHGLGARSEELRAVGGAARSATWRRLQADILGLPVRRAVADEGPAFGAALLGGVAAGVYDGPRQAMERVSVHPETTEPDPAWTGRYDEAHGIYRGLYADLRSDLHRLDALDR